MSDHEDLVYLNHILEAIRKIEKSTATLSKDSIIKNDDIIDATIRRLEIIGEAVKNISNKTRESYKNIEWKKIAGFRDILIHGYFKVDLDVVWKAIEEELPILKKQVLQIINDIESDNSQEKQK